MTGSLDQVIAHESFGLLLTAVWFYVGRRHLALRAGFHKPISRRRTAAREQRWNVMPDGGRGRSACKITPPDGQFPGRERDGVASAP